MKGHYALEEPALGIPMVGLLLNVLMIALLWHFAGRMDERVNVGWDDQVMAGAPVLELRPDEKVFLNGQEAPTPDDLQVRLSGLAANGNQLVVTYPKDLAAWKLAQVLKVVSSAGFTNVQIRENGAGGAT